MDEWTMTVTTINSGRITMPLYENDNIFIITNVLLLGWEKS